MSFAANFPDASRCSPVGPGGFREAAHYYEGQQDGLGRRFVSAVDDAFARIAKNPTLFRVVFEDVRKCRVIRFPYGVLYRVRTEQIQIVAVMHLKRDPDYWSRECEGGKPASEIHVLRRAIFSSLAPASVVL